MFGTLVNRSEKRWRPLENLLSHVSRIRVDGKKSRDSNVNTGLYNITFRIDSMLVRYSPKMARLSLTVSVLASGAAGAATAAATRAKAINTCARHGERKKQQKINTS